MIKTLLSPPRTQRSAGEDLITPRCSAQRLGGKIVFGIKAHKEIVITTENTEDTEK